MIGSRRNQAKSIRNRLKELDSLIEKVYDDYGAGILSADRIKKLLMKYEKESEVLKQQLESLTSIDNPADSNPSDLEKILQSISEPDELSQGLLYKLIDHIEIGQGVYEKTEFGKKKRQCVKIYFRFRHESMTKNIVLNDIQI